MVLADVGQGDLIITMFWLFILMLWFWLLITVFADLFADKDESTGKKVLWTLFVIFMPYLGVFVYLIARGHKMAERDIEDMQAQDAAMKEYIRSAAGSSASAADELERLAQLKAAGTISEEEFNQMKAKIVG